MKPNTTLSSKNHKSQSEGSQPKYQKLPLYEVKFSVVNKQQYEVVPKAPETLLTAFKSGKEPWRLAVRAVRFAQGQIQLSLRYWQDEKVVRGLEKELSEVYQVQLQAVDDYVFDIPRLDSKSEIKEDLRSLGAQNDVTIVKMDKRGECWWFSVATVMDAALIQRREKFVVLGVEYPVVPKVHKARAIFCFKCCLPGHTTEECQSKKTVCGKCSAENSHLTRNCTVKPEHYLCPLCSEDRNHSSGSSECLYEASQNEHSKARTTKPCHPWWTNLKNIKLVEQLISSTASDLFMKERINPTSRENEHVITTDNAQGNNKFDAGGICVADNGAENVPSTAANVWNKNDQLAGGDRVAGNKRPSNEMANSSFDNQPPKKKNRVGRPRKIVKSGDEKGERVKNSTEKQNLLTQYMRTPADVDCFFEGLPYYSHGEGGSSEPETANNSFSSNLQSNTR